jgi:cytochrome c-type biogenesis protein CcmH/NrfG
VALILALAMAVSLVAYYFGSTGSAPRPQGAGRPVASSGSSLQGDQYVQQGTQAYDAGDYNGAIRAYEQSLTWRGKDPGVLTDLGTAYYYRTPSDPAKAIEYYDRALGIDPGFPNALFNKGLVLFEGQRKPAEALPVWEKLVSLLPANDPSVGKVKAFIAQAQAALNAPSATPVPAAPGFRLSGGFGR